MALFKSETPETVLDRILSRMGTDLQTREGSYAYDLAAPIAFEIWRELMTLDKLIEAFYVNENSGPYLDEHARLFAISRREGTKARAELTLFGKDGTVVPAGTAFYAGGLEYRLTAEAVIRDGFAAGLLEAAEIGQEYNVSAGSIHQILRNIVGLERFESAPADGGTDPETDKDLFARLDEKRKRPPTSGNEAHYREWALSVAGVGAVRVDRLWHGPGTVRVLIVDYQGRPVGPAVVDACAKYIETQRPVGADVTVSTAEEHPVDVSARVVLAPTADLAGVREAFVSKLDDYLGETAFEAFIVYTHRVGALLMEVEGVVDYYGLTLNGVRENLVLNTDCVPVRGEVSLT